MRGSRGSGTKTALEDYASSSVALFSIIQNTIMAPEVNFSENASGITCSWVLGDASRPPNILAKIIFMIAFGQNTNTHLHPSLLPLSLRTRLETARY